MSTKKYKYLYKTSQNKSSEDVFAHFPFDINNGETWEAPYERLVKLARLEDWNFHRPEFKLKYKQKYPILTNYLNYTFMHAQYLNLIVFSDNDDKACFNTGLQTSNEKDIFALFFRNKGSLQHNAPDWTFYSFVDSYSDKLKPYGNTLPELPTYIDDPSDLVFDTKLEIEINTEHIIETNKVRLPSPLQENNRLAMMALNGAIESIKSKVIRNYKVAIPHWYNNKLQLLLPLNLTDDKIADVALVVDKDKDRNIYKAVTILPMDWAYIDARLITRPDREWLNP
ncbi:MAG: DUF3825 domain-containing protein [Treponema sp.]|nr:DUF3825 domain-containing protein [Treponema sp.]